MPQMPLFDVGQQGKSASVSAQRHLGLYAEIAANGDKTRLSFYGTPGLTLDYSYGDTPVRGSIGVGDVKYEVHRGKFWEVNNAGVRTSRGTLATTSGRVEMAYNGTQIAIVDGTSMYLYTIASTAFATVSSGLFANPVSVTFGDGYFIACFRNSGRFQISGLYDGATWDALEYATAESNPDGLLRVMYDHGELLLFGELTTEFWSNTGGQDFPYSAIRGAAQEFGLAAVWSLTKYNDSIAGVFKNSMGQVQVMMLRGHAFAPLTKPEDDHNFNNYDAVADATAFSYMLGGHPMLQVNFPTPGKSWLYDATTTMWSPLESGLSGGRARGEIRTDYLNKPRITDYSNGNVYTLDVDAYTDNGTIVPREIITRHFFQDERRVAVHELRVDFEMGVGLTTGQGSNPQVMLQVSKDGGHTWGNELWTTIGAQGVYSARAIWRRLGSGRDWVFKIRITDPVKVVITGASLEYEVRN